MKLRISKRNLFKPQSWVMQNGLHKELVVYRVWWEGKWYVGATRHLNIRLNWWRTRLRGKEAYIQALYLCATEDEMYALEEATIKRLGTFTYGHNKTETGRSGTRMPKTPEWRRNLAKAHIGMVTSEATKEKLRIAKKGTKDSEEIKQRKSVAAKLRWEHSKRGNSSERLFRRNQLARESILWAFGVKIV